MTPRLMCPLWRTVTLPASRDLRTGRVGGQPSSAQRRHEWCAVAPTTGRGDRARSARVDPPSAAVVRHDVAGNEQTRTMSADEPRGDDPVPPGLVLDLDDAFRVLESLEDARLALRQAGAAPGLQDELATVIRLLHGRLGLDEGACSERFRVLLPRGRSSSWCRHPRDRPAMYERRIAGSACLTERSASLPMPLTTSKCQQADTLPDRLGGRAVYCFESGASRRRSAHEPTPMIATAATTPNSPTRQPGGRHSSESSPDAPAGTSTSTNPIGPVRTATASPSIVARYPGQSSRANSTLPGCVGGVRHGHPFTSFGRLDGLGRQPVGGPAHTIVVGRERLDAPEHERVGVGLVDRPARRDLGRRRRARWRDRRRRC